MASTSAPKKGSAHHLLRPLRLKLQQFIVHSPAERARANSCTPVAVKPIILSHDGPPLLA